MKQIIRNQTFETNSSSMHSLVVVKDPKPYKVDEYGTFSHYIGDAEFDLFDSKEGIYERFPFQVMRTPLDKLRYYVAHYIGFLNKKELISNVINFINEQTGIPKDKINIKTYNDYRDKYEGYGYAGINDTGEDVFTYIEKNNISMEEFVLNSKYVVIIDGDEYQEFKKLFDSNILDANNFEYISSGTSFWNDDIFTIRLNWMVNSYCDFNLLTKVNDINKFIKEIHLELNEQTLPLYDQCFNELKMFIEEVRKNRPDIIVIVEYEKGMNKKVRSKDLSIFDFIGLKDNEYGEITERIKIF